MKRILVWDSSEEIKNKIAENLGENFEIEVIQSHPSYHRGDLVIFDLPSMGTRGLDLCSAIKENPETEYLSVVCLTNGKSEMAVAGYSAGADDCFSFDTERKEFLARIRARLKSFRAKTATKIFVENGLIELDTVNQTLKAIDSKSDLEIMIELTPHEFRLLLYLVERKTKIVARSELMGAVWSDKVNVLPRTIDKHISSLRDKVKDVCRLESVRGNGYILNITPRFTSPNPNSISG